MFGYEDPCAEVEHGLGPGQAEGQDEHGAHHGGRPPQPFGDAAADPGDDLVVSGSLKFSRATDGSLRGGRSVEQKRFGRAGVVSENDRLWHNWL